MKRYANIVAFLVLASLSSAGGSSDSASKIAATCITHVTVIDPRTALESRDQTVIITVGRVTKVGDSKTVNVPSGAKVVDGSGRYLIPGLWDMHVHGTQYDSTLPLYIANGVTGVREMFGPPDANHFRASLGGKHLIAPHLYLGSPIIDGNPPFWRNSIVVESPEQARRVVDEQKQRGADFIKIYPRLKPEVYFAILDEARRQNIRVAGHIPSRITAWQATAAKQRSIEHSLGIALACSTRESELQPKASATKNMLEGDQLDLEAWRSYSHEKCSRLFEEFKRNETWVVPTLTVYKTFGLLNNTQFRSDSRMRYFGGEFRNWLEAKDDPRLKSWSAADFQLERELYEQERKIVGELFRAGVSILAGTDVGNPYCFPGFSLHDELAYFVDAGMSPAAALRTATWNPAEFMAATDRYGSIEPGKIADLVMLDADPLQDIHNTSKIFAVFEGGIEFNRGEIDAILKRAAQTADASTEGN